ncbi:uncharacterized protein DUF4352 [Stackebrandtia albiflava]|uniref:Uncharacterized protein DUF4352 n=1 Tax=Stackebrandtia albiflava TaxID=406432 RepID=A0A562UL72_9ACTN|nr:uncharacterized protein DUF4352 [Stackebrandtia albiflava]
MLLGVVGVVLLLGIVAIGVVVATTGSDTSDDTAEEGTEEGPAGRVPTTELPGIGEEAEDGTFAFTVNQVQTGVPSVGDEFTGTSAQGEYVVIDLNVRNIGDSPATVYDTDQYLIDSAGQTYNVDSDATFAVDPEAAWYNDINPGNQVIMPLVYDVPPGTDIDRLELHDSTFSDGVEVSIAQLVASITRRADHRSARHVAVWNHRTRG